MPSKYPTPWIDGTVMDPALLWRLLGTGNPGRLPAGTRWFAATRRGRLTYEARRNMDRGGVPSFRLGYLGKADLWDYSSFYIDGDLVDGRVEIRCTSDIYDVAPVSNLYVDEAGVTHAEVSSIVDRIEEQATRFIEALLDEGVRFPN